MDVTIAVDPVDVAVTLADEVFALVASDKMVSKQLTSWDTASDIIVALRP